MKKIISWLIGAVVIFAILFMVFYFARAEILRQTTIILLMAFGMCLLRIMVGPTAADRSICVDTIGILVVGFCGLMGIFTGHDWYLDIAIAWALQGFIGTLALAKYLEGRDFDE